jgi:hypothetical protein
MARLRSLCARPRTRTRIRRRSSGRRSTSCSRASSTGMLRPSIPSASASTWQFGPAPSDRNRAPTAAPRGFAWEGNVSRGRTLLARAGVDGFVRRKGTVRCQSRHSARVTTRRRVGRSRRRSWRRGSRARRSPIFDSAPAAAFRTRRLGWRNASTRAGTASSLRALPTPIAPHTTTSSSASCSHPAIAGAAAGSHRRASAARAVKRTSSGELVANPMRDSTASGVPSLPRARIARTLVCRCRDWSCASAIRPARRAGTSAVRRARGPRCTAAPRWWSPCPPLAQARRACSRVETDVGSATGTNPRRGELGTSSCLGIRGAERWSQITRPWRTVFSVTTRGSTKCSR